MSIKNLPPGVTDRMIEEHANGPAPVDTFAEEQLEIERLRAEIEEWRGDGGRYGDQDPNVMHQIESRQAEIRRLQSLPRFWTVAVYLVDRAYGGPEEGGWWYDHGARQDHPLDGVDPTVLLQVAFSEEQAEVLRGMAQDALNRTINVGRRDIGSLLSTGRYDAIVYNGYPPTIWPTTRPHYE